VTNHQGWSTARILSPATAEITWDVTFEPAADRAYSYATQAPTGLSVERVGLDGVTLRWGAQYYLNAGYQVYLDGVLLGYSGHTEFPLRGLDPARAYTAEVRAVWDDASIGPRHQKAELKFSLGALLPDVMPLSAIEPARVGGGARGGGRGVAAPPAVTRSGKRHDAVIAARAGTEVEYDLKGLYTSFTAQAVLDDAFQGTIELAAVGDGKTLWTSGPLGAGADRAKPVEVSIAGVRRLVLKATASGAGEAGARGQGGAAGPGGGRAGAQAAWVEARVSGLAAGK
jgi:hypothetical protein